MNDDMVQTMTENLTLQIAADAGLQSAAAVYAAVYAASLTGPLRHVEAREAAIQAVKAWREDAEVMRL